MADQIVDPGPDVADKILNGLEEFVDPPAEIARKARRLRAHIMELRGALEVFANCVDQIDPDEADDEWAKFRLEIKDYRRAAKALGR